MSVAAATRRSSSLSVRPRERRRVVGPAKVQASKPLRSRSANFRVNADQDSICIPSWVVDHASFRQWFHQPGFPEEGRVSFLNGEVIFDTRYEQIFSQVRVKTEIARVLATLAKRELNGVFFGDGLLISHQSAEVSNNPDGVLVANASFEDGAVRLVEGAKEGYIELEGSPDMVLEVVSDSLVTKDYMLLREAYWRAGVREYWLVDARGGRLKFQILKHGGKGYSLVRPAGGWLKSAVFRKSFRLIATKNHLGHPDFELQVQ